ncbi:MAG: cytochrome c-type biogenesis protein CcmH [Acidimicrobiia bacterium]
MRRWAWIGLAVIVVVAMGGALWPRGGHETVSAHVHRLAGELRCVDCEGLSVADSATSAARGQRRDIAERVRSGESDETIRDWYVQTYGENILLRPAGRGVGLIVWGLPIGAVFLAAVGLTVALRRWRREPRLTPTAEDAAFVAEHRGR